MYEAMQPSQAGQWARQSLLLIMLVSTPIAQAQSPFRVEVGYEAEGTDNVRREDADTEDELIHRPFLTVGYAQQFGRVDLSSDYRLEARRYQRDSFDGDEVLVGRSAIDVALMPGRLSWLTDHVRSETLLDRRDADRPDNRRESDTLGTGLTWILGGQSANRFTTSARAERFDSNRGFDDSARYSGALDYRRRVSTVQGVGLRVSGLSVDYDSDRVPGYDRWSLLATMDRELRRSGMELGVGYNEVQRSGEASRGGLAVSGSGYFEPASGHRFTLSAQREFTDRSEQAIRGIPEFGDDRDQDRAEGNVFELTSLGVEYDYQRARWTFGVGLSATEEDYEVVLRDNRRLLGTLKAGYRMTPVIDMDLALRMQRREFSDENRTDDLYALDLRWVWQIVPSTSVSLGFGYQQRDSNAGRRSYDERRVVFTLRHRLW